LVLCIAIGNPLRGDDGVARRALRQLAPAEQIRMLKVIQLTPELAPEIAAAEAVMFLDADPSIAEVTFGALGDCSTRSTPLTHSMGPFELLETARRLYCFAGEALLCRIPARQFEPGKRLTHEAETAARFAAKLVGEHLSRLVAQHRQKWLPIQGESLRSA
jgi:hydrogenase maturation protease